MRQEEVSKKTKDDTQSRTDLYRTGRRYVYLYCTVTSLGLGNKLISGVSLPAVYYIQYITVMTIRDVSIRGEFPTEDSLCSLFNTLIGVVLISGMLIIA